MKMLLKNINHIETMNEEREIIKKGYIYIDEGIIKNIGTDNPPSCDNSYDMQGYVILPGFVNTHHHLYQSLFRNVKEVTSSKLFDWLVYLYEKWKNIDNEAVYISALTALYEMMHTGVTTSTDMLYLHPKGMKNFIDSEIDAALRTGIRFHPTRGFMTLSKKDGGLPPDSVVQKMDDILEDIDRLINKYHDPKKHSMLRIAIAPCSPFSVTKESMEETVDLSNKYGVLLHTHLAETKDEEEFCIQKFGKRPVDYMEEIGWLNDKAWFAHLVWLSGNDIDKLKKNDCGMAHCPLSNMRLGSGIAPVKNMYDKKIRIGIAVDGSASNDSGNFIQEVRTALMLQRVKNGADALTPRDVLYMATMGGAKVLRMDDYIGSIEAGKSADIIGFKMDKLGFAGGLSDPATAVVMCDAGKVDFSMINGEIRIKDSKIVNENIDKIIEKQNSISERLLNY